MALTSKIRRCCGITPGKRYSVTFMQQVAAILTIFIVVQYLLYQVSNQHTLSGSSSHTREFAATNPPAVTNISSALNVTNKPSISIAVKGPENVINPKEVFSKGKWNSSFVSKFHAHFDINCAAIIRGDSPAINAAKRILMRNPSKLPDDRTVKDWTSDCGIYQSARRYPVVPSSLEEAEYPIAYIMAIHTETAQFERLFRAIYQPQNVYCIHPDAKSPPPFQNAVRSLAACFPNVFIATKPVAVHYAHSSRLQADVNCMSDLLNRSEPWNYALNLCGQDFPLKTNLEIVRQLKAFKGHNDIPGVVAPNWFDHRTRVHHEFRNGMMVKLKEIKKPPPPQDFKFHFGNAYYAATRGFVDYIIHNQTAIDLLRYSEDTYSPDEHYWVTLHRMPGVPGGVRRPSWDSIVRFVKWSNTDKYPRCVGKYVRNICIFGAGYVQYLSKDQHLFGNKFHMSYDPIAMQCMEELLDYRSRFPEAISDFVSN